MWFQIQIRIFRSLSISCRLCWIWRLVSIRFFVHLFFRMCPIARHKHHHKLRLPVVAFLYPLGIRNSYLTVSNFWLFDHHARNWLFGRRYMWSGRIPVFDREKGERGWQSNRVLPHIIFSCLELTKLGTYRHYCHSQWQLRLCRLILHPIHVHNSKKVIKIDQK